MRLFKWRVGKQSKLDAIHEDIYTRIDKVSQVTKEASESFDPVNEMLDSGGFTEWFFLATRGGGKYIDGAKAKK